MNEAGLAFIVGMVAGMGIMTIIGLNMIVQNLKIKEMREMHVSKNSEKY